MAEHVGDPQPGSQTHLRDGDTDATPSEAPRSGVSRRQLFRAGAASATLVAIGAIDPKLAVAADLGDQGLLLKLPGLRRRVSGFFDALRDQPAIRAQFLESPTQLLVDHFFADRRDQIPPQVVSDGNRLLYSALANDEFRSWVASFQAELDGEREAGLISDGASEVPRIKQELARALAQFGDQEILFGLINASKEAGGWEGQGQKSTFVAVEFVVLAIFVAVVNVVVTQFDATPVIERSTQLNPVSSADLRNISEELIRRARQLHESGALLDPAMEI